MRRTITALSFAVVTATTTLAAQQGPAPKWNLLLGGGAIAMPSYPGSDEYMAIPFPLAKVTYRDRLYAGPSTAGTGFAAGAYAVRTPALSVAAEVGFQPDRPADRAEALAGMEDHSFESTAGVSVGLTLGPLQGVVSATQGLNEGTGLLAGAQLTFTWPVMSRTIAIIGAGTTFADAKQMRWDFGVSSAEATRRQSLLDGGNTVLPSDAGTPYTPHGGLRQVSASLTLVQFLTAHWAVIGISGVDRLSDEAAGSSLVRDRMQWTGGLAVGYQF